MAEKFNPDSKLSPQELAKHLRQPTGETGKQVGEHMNKGNKHICLNTYKVLDPQKGNHMLEIGMGNGLFINDLMAVAADLTYVGLDFSATMVQEAMQLNEEWMAAGKVSFEEASIEQLPFEEDVFDCISSTNTLYFWPQPAGNAKELLRVLKPGGKLVLGYRSKSFMDQIELSRYGFTKYEVADVETLLREAGFKKVKTHQIAEPELEFDGKTMTMIGYYTEAFK